MRFWIRRAEKEPPAACVAAEHEGVSAFAVVTPRGVVRALAALCVACARLRRARKHGRR